MTYAIAAFIEEKLGSKYIEVRTVEFSKSYEETSPSTPIFFILSPGVNPLKVITRYFLLVVSLVRIKLLRAKLSPITHGISKSN